MDVNFSICRKITIFGYKSQKANNMKNMKAQNLPERNSKPSFLCPKRRKSGLIQKFIASM
jgi:hypothetical protein